MFIHDNVLVERSIAGDRQAFAEIIGRYQSLVCSIAYGQTGSLEASEELAQEAFLSAWRSLASLKDAEKLRPWLCGVIRNLANNRNRRMRRDVMHDAVDFHSEGASSLTDPQAVDPKTESIAREEIELLDRSLASLPEMYREPLVLFHRQEQSVARVAELLDLNPNTVKQRLVRGREMLRAEIAELVERGLNRSAPGRTFTLGVLAALPAVPAMTTTAQAATLSATAAVPGAAIVKASVWTTVVGAIAGPILGLMGGWLGYKLSIQSARSERERQFIRKSTRIVLVVIASFALLLSLLLGFGIVWAKTYPILFATMIASCLIGYLLSIAALVIWHNRCAKSIRREEGTDGTVSPDQLASTLPKWVSTTAYPRHYESSWRLFGLPLVSVRFRGTKQNDASFGAPAKGWIAIGDFAVGVLFASGGIAIGGIAFGGISVGLISCGGMGIGVVSLAGAALGWWANGGIGLGVVAFGGLSFAWKVASGGVAIAREAAVGGIALAHHANNETAQAIVNSHPFLVYSLQSSAYGVWIAITFASLLPMVLALTFVKPKRE